MPVTRLAGLLYGGDYNPEQWPEEVWEEDVRLMREAGVNFVTVGVFSWSALQPGPDQWDFGWLDRVMDLLHENGVAVNLATPSCAPPQWLIEAHPEIIPVGPDGLRWSDNSSREHFCASAPAFREATAVMAEALATRYGSHPALVMWHINNELHTRCHCDVAAEAFRTWLKDRYGTLGALNQSWGNSFWGQHFTAWSQVMPSRHGGMNPAQSLDYARFSSDTLLESYLVERAVLKRITPHIPTTNNWYGLSLGGPRRTGTKLPFDAMHSPSVLLDHWRWAPDVDVVASDEYPDPTDPEASMLGALDYDFLRSLKGGAPWIVTESSPGATAWKGFNVRKPAGLVRLWSLQMVAHGADAIMFFQWRASRFGQEKFESGMVSHAGIATHRWPEIRDLGADLGRLAEVAGARSTADVAVMHDQESAWAFDQPGHPNTELRYREILIDAYRPLHDRNIAVDFVHPAGDLGRYRLVVIPNLHLVSEESARRITDYVAGGGTVLVGPFSGIVDVAGQVYLGGHPAPFREMLGLRVEDFYPQGPDAIAVRFGDGQAAAARQWADWIETEGAEIIATFEGTMFGEVDGRPAITRHRRGKGAAWYAGTFLDEAGMAFLVGRVLDDAGVTPVADVPAGIEVTRRERDGDAYLFVLNHTTDEADVPLADVAGTDLLTGAAVARHVHLGPRGAAVVQLDRG